VTKDVMVYKDQVVKMEQKAKPAPQVLLDMSVQKVTGVTKAQKANTATLVSKGIEANRVTKGRPVQRVIQVYAEKRERMVVMVPKEIKVFKGLRAIKGNRVEMAPKVRTATRERMAEMAPKASAEKTA
jgi:tRNA uridine 5-carbamoylmethylation protein Kti12